MNEQSIQEIEESAIKGMAKKLNIDYEFKNNTKLLQEIKNKDVSMFNKLDNFLKIYKKYSTYISKIENIKKIRDINQSEKEELKNLIYKRDKARKEMEL